MYLHITTLLDIFIFVGCFTCAPDSFELAHDTDLRVGVELLSG